MNILSLETCNPDRIVSRLYVYHYEISYVEVDTAITV
jgi:hypothetical protein